MLKIKSVTWFLTVLLSFSIKLPAQNLQFLNSEQDQFQVALELFESEQYGNAKKLFDQINQDHLLDRETQTRAQYYAALCAIELFHGDSEERVDAFARLHETSPLVNRLHLRYANNQFSLKRYSKAIRYYERVNDYRLSKQEKNEFLFKKGYSLLSMERSAEALPLFFSLKDKESPFANSARYYYAHLLYVDSNYAEALQNFLPLQEDVSFGPLVPYYLAHIYYALEDYDQIVKLGVEVDQATPSRAPEIAKLLADAFYEKGDYANVLKYLDLFREKGGAMRTKDHYQRGYAAYRLGQFEEAMQSFNKITRGPNDLLQNTYYHLGDCYLKTNKRNKAMTAFKAAAEYDDDPQIKEDAAYNYAKLSYELANPYEDAIVILQNYLDNYPQSAHRQKINSYLANIYITTKDYKKALEAIERSGDDSPEIEAAKQRITFFQASEQFNDGRYAASLKLFKRVSANASLPNYNTLSLYWRAECQYRLGEFEKSAQLYEQFRSASGATQTEPYSRSYYHSGYAYYKLFDFEKSARDLRIFVRGAAKTDPRLADAYLRLGDSYLLTQGYLIAADFYAKAVNANTPQADYALFQRAECLGLEGQGEAKIKNLRQLHAQYPNSNYAESAFLEIGLSYLQMERYPQALQAFDDFKAKYPSSNKLAAVELKKGLIYSNTDQDQEAINTYRNIVRRYPETQEAIEAIGLAEINYKRLRDMESYLDWVEDIDFIDFEESTLDSTAYTAAFEAYASGECREAIKAFDNYLERFENGFFKLKALQLAAECAYKTNQDSLAANYYRQIAELPINDFSLKAFQFLAQDAAKRQEWVEVKNWNGRILDLKPNSAATQNAQVGLMRSALALGDYAQAIEQANDILNNLQGDPSLKGELIRVKANSHFALGQFDEALPFFLQMQKSSSGDAQVEGFFYQALILQEKEEFDSSNAVINNMIEALPSYKEWKLKGLLLVAYNFWQLDDVFQANYILDFVEESDFSPALNQQAAELRQDIKAAEERALKAKQKQLEQQASPIKLDTLKGLEIIDAPSESEPEEPIEIIER
jgi:tetratricopeptide (TPR) repeat protein